MSKLNSDHLRTFLAVVEAGSVTGGAVHIARSQSAASLQIKQLEDVVGKPLFERHGRGVVLTAAGEALQPAARDVVQKLDRALAELRGERLTGRLRLGMPDDHGGATLAGIVSEFAATNPGVELEVQCTLGLGFEDAISSGKLDLAVFEVPIVQKTQTILREDSLVWLRRSGHEFGSKEVLPVALFDRTCWWRNLALSSLKQAGRKFRIVFSSESAAGVRAAVTSGMAVGLLRAGENIKSLAPVHGLETRHPTFLILQKAQTGSAPATSLSEAIRKAFRR